MPPHEIAHGLGFTSGVDLVDQFSPNGPGAAVDFNGTDEGNGELDNFALFTTLDLLRFSSESVDEGSNVLDVAYGGTPFTSLDGGATSLALMSRGAFNGSPAFQASHFLSNANLLGPAFGPGSLRLIGDNDVIAIDAIGFNLAIPVPEPSLAGGWLVATAIFVRRRRR